MNTPHPVFELLTLEGLPGLASLYMHAASSQTIDISSVTLNPSCRTACDHVITKAADLFGIYPLHLSLYASLRRFGDGSGMFGFGAKRYIDGAWVDVNIPEHIALIAGAVDAFNRQHLVVVDSIANGFAYALAQGHAARNNTRLS